MYLYLSISIHIYVDMECVPGAGSCKWSVCSVLADSASVAVILLCFTRSNIGTKIVCRTLKDVSTKLQNRHHKCDIVSFHVAGGGCKSIAGVVTSLSTAATPPQHLGSGHYKVPCRHLQTITPVTAAAAAAAGCRARHVPESRGREEAQTRPHEPRGAAAGRHLALLHHVHRQLRLRHRRRFRLGLHPVPR